MAGVLSGRSVIKGTRLTLGYRTVRAMQNNCLLAAGETVRGHEFHFSSMQDGTATVPSAYEVLDQPVDVKGSLCIMSSPRTFISIWVVKPVWRHASSPPARARGNQREAQMHTPRRVVSLSPNVSMILFALGADAVVVGRTQDCLSAIQHI